jgi:hypothetical protein
MANGKVDMPALDASTREGGGPPDPAREQRLQREAQQQEGYAIGKEDLERRYNRQLDANPQATAEEKRQMVHDVAVNYSRSIKDNVGDRGRGWERIESRDFETGQRKALMEFSHNNNHELRLQQEQAVLTGPKPAAQLSNKEIVAEARELHSQFHQLAEKFEQAPANQKAEIREQMTPLVTRENELRQEFTGRLNPEIKQDRLPERQISYGY